MRIKRLISSVFVAAAITASFGLASKNLYAGQAPMELTDSHGHYEKISKDLNLYYHDSGRGPVMLFIPGWTMPSDVFKAQIDYFDKNYRVIAIDPRSQGRSTKTLENNNYTQHGEDLGKFIDALKLKNVTLVAWSWGCLDAYSYMRQKGVDNLHAFVCVDASPKPSGNKTEWAAADYQDWGVDLIQPVIYNREAFSKAWAQSMVERQLTADEQNWIVNESLHTPTFAAIGLASDAIYADYQPEAELLDEKKIPTLDFLDQALSANAMHWLQNHAPHAKTKIMGKHFMFWERPNEFNQTLNEFLGGKYKESSAS